MLRASLAEGATQQEILTDFLTVSSEALLAVIERCCDRGTGRGSAR